MIIPFKPPIASIAFSTPDKKEANPLSKSIKKSSFINALYTPSAAALTLFEAAAQDSS